MDIRTTAIAAAGLAVWLGMGTAPAHAQNTGIIACEIQLGMFARDVEAAGGSLGPQAREAARDVIDVGVGQCRSGPQLTMSNIHSTRHAIGLPGSQANRPLVATYWSPSSENMASLPE